MKITKSKLEKIIEEEISLFLETYIDNSDKTVLMEDLSELKKVIFRKGIKKKKEITQAKLNKNKKAFLMSPKRKAALQKARLKANTSSSKIRRKKTMTIRKRYRK